MFLGKGVLKISSKFTGEQCRRVIKIKLLCNFIEILFQHGCSNLLHIPRTPFSTEELLLHSPSFIRLNLVVIFPYMSVFHWQFLITYIFPVSLKFGACCYITGQRGWCQGKECYFMFIYSFLAFFTSKRPELAIRSCQWICMT